MLAKIKLNSIETLISQDKGIYFWVNRKDLEVESDVPYWVQIFDKCDPKNWHGNKSWRIYYNFEEENKYEKIKENLRTDDEKYEIMRLSSVKSKT